MSTQSELFGGKKGRFVCKGGRSTFIEDDEESKNSTSTTTTESNTNIKPSFTEKIKELMNESIKNYFKEQEESLEQPRKELYELSLKLNGLGYANVFDKVSYYLQVHGNNKKSIEFLKKEIKDVIQDKENMMKEYEQLVFELKMKYNIDYSDNPLKDLTKDFFYEKNAILILKERLKESKKVNTNYF